MVFQTAVSSSEKNGYTLREVASRVGGELMGDAAAVALTLCSLEEPAAKGITFLKDSTRASELSSLRSVQVAAVLVPKDFDKQLTDKLSLGYTLNIIRVADPFKSLIELVPMFYTAPALRAGIDPQACIDPSAIIGDEVSIGPFTWIGANVVIENGVTIYPHVSVYPGARLGARTIVHAGAIIREHCIVEADCIIQNGAVIGAEGFGYIPDKKIGLQKVPQIGSTRLAQAVEIGANACVDRATLGCTVLDMGTKVDNLVQIGHNTKIGKYSIICGLAGIAGSCKIGSNVVIGGAVGVKDHAVIADGCRIAGKSEVWGELKVPGDYLGAPAIPHVEKKRQLAALAQLPEFMKSFRKGGKKREGAKE